LSGTYFYTFNGSAASTNQPAPYGELGKLVADGLGGITGNSFSSQNGIPASASFSGTYMVTPSCTGNLNVAIDSQSVALNFQVVKDGQSAILGFSRPSGVVAVGQA